MLKNTDIFFNTKASSTNFSKSSDGTVEGEFFIEDFFIDSQKLIGDLCSVDSQPLPARFSISQIVANEKSIPSDPIFIPHVDNIKIFNLSQSDTESISSNGTNTSNTSSSCIVTRRERNRQAAERCRRRKVELIERLQRENVSLMAERDALIIENRRLTNALFFLSSPKSS